MSFFLSSAERDGEGAARDFATACGTAFSFLSHLGDGLRDGTLRSLLRRRRRSLSLLFAFRLFLSFRSLEVEELEVEELSLDDGVPPRVPPFPG